MSFFEFSSLHIARKINEIEMKKSQAFKTKKFNKILNLLTLQIYANVKKMPEFTVKEKANKKELSGKCLTSFNVVVG